MKQWSLDTLEYSLVKEKVKEFASSTMGKKMLDELVPSPTKDCVCNLLRETEEGLHLLRLKGDVSLIGVYDIRNSLRRASISGVLNEEECVEIGSTIYAGRKMKSLLRQIDKEHVHLFPIFKEMTEQIVSLDELQQSIEKCIDEQGYLRDDASTSLCHIRQNTKGIKHKITETLHQILRSSHYSKMIQESLVTTRNNRYVLPIKQEYRGMMKGIVHDQSSSGATLFIEPEAVFQLNNQLRALELDEQKERERILIQLTHAIGEEVDALSSNLQILAKLDMILAKAGWGRSQRAVCAKVAPGIALKKARHPFIPSYQAVPIDVLFTDYRAMLITGPNAGGKTVILKTVGLFALMTQSGIPIPAEEESKMPVFSGVFADIGDEQSIEQSLSTFSGHLTNIIQILNRIDSHSLILLDELGAGTDPVEGTALATSILEYIIERGCVAITTTHFSELKYFAYNHPDTVNASVEFDVETLSPTYRLIIGTPGSSNAFAISQRLGLPKDIIEKAKTYLSGEENSFEKGIEHLQKTRKIVEEERERVAKATRESERLKEELREQMNQWEEKRVRLEEEARLRTQKIVEIAHREVEEVLKQIEQERLTSSIKEHHLIEAKTRLRKVIPEVAPKLIQKETSSNIQQDINMGDEVMVTHLSQVGTIMEKLNDEEYVVQVGALKMKMRQGQLEKRAMKERPLKKNVYSLTRSDDMVTPELHLRGKAMEEAVFELEKYLDDVLLTGYKQVSIVHGKGTGVLRLAVQDVLRQHRSVKSFRLGQHGEGGAGVTIVELG